MTATVALLLAALLVPHQEEKDPDVESKDLTLGGDKTKRYFFIGPQKGVETPKTGFKLAIVLPGGDGSAEFHPFVRRVWKESLGTDYLLLQPVAIEWKPGQNDSNTWPTKRNTAPGMKYTTEEFVEALILDTAKKHKIDPKKVFTLSWSSGGPPAYAISLQERRLVTGAFIVMSVFREQDLPPLRNAKGQAYYLLHSPEDETCKIELAKTARDELKKKGASVEFVEYKGGHAWPKDVYAFLRTGFEWLEKVAR